MDYSHHHQETTWKSYLPLLVVVIYIVGGTAILGGIVPNADWMRKIMFFEGLMLSLFALFKLLDVKGFQEGYSTYDLITQKIPVWGYLYPFLELGLGVLLLLNLWTLLVSYGVALLAVVGLISVSIELKKDRKFQCACLGTALKVPLTKVTLVENGIMLLLALIMAFSLSNPGMSSMMNMENAMHQNHGGMITNDRDFLKHMVPHHQDAVDASLVVASRTENSQVKQLAESIITAQNKEISEMKAWYKNWYGTDFPANTGYVPMMGDYQSMSLKDLDKRYLSEMIEHHQSAIEMAELMRNAERPEIKNLAQTIITTQQQEIEVMKQILVNSESINYAGH